MKKKNIVNEPYKYKDYIIYLERVNQENYKFGISVGKKVGNAVTRNKIKRQLKSIIDKKNYQNNFNCIIIVGRGVVMRTFKELEQNLYHAFDSLNIYEEDNDEK